MQNASGREVDAINAGILTLLFIVYSLLSGFALFFIYLKRKAKQAEN